MRRSKEIIELEDLIIGAVYIVSARNFSIAIWDGHQFQGLRYKFGDYFIFPEDHYDSDDKYGTAQPLVKLMDGGEAEDIVKIILKEDYEGSSL